MSKWSIELDTSHWTVEILKICLVVGGAMFALFILALSAHSIWLHYFAGCSDAAYWLATLPERCL